MGEGEGEGEGEGCTDVVTYLGCLGGRHTRCLDGGDVGGPDHEQLMELEMGLGRGEPRTLRASGGPEGPENADGGGHPGHHNRDTAQRHGPAPAHLAGVGGHGGQRLEGNGLLCLHGNRRVPDGSRQASVVAALRVCQVRACSMPALVESYSQVGVLGPLGFLRGLF